MNILNRLFTDRLAMDLGTVNTLIYDPSRGVVLNEPSAVAINRFTGETIAVGAEAARLLGREPHDTILHRPIRGGTISDFNAAQKMVTAFIRRVHGSRRSHLVIGVPSASTTLEQRSVKDAARDAKATRVDLVNDGLASALGAGLDFEDERARLVVDIGGGTTNVATVASSAVIASTSLQVAGNSMDEAIRDYVRSKYEMQIGEPTAEQVKIELGATCCGEMKKVELRRMEVVGKKVTDGMARSIELTSDEVSQALEPVLAEIMTGVRRVVEEAPPEVTADIFRSGIILTGGGALLRGMAERMQNELCLHTVVADDPLLAVVHGAGRLLMDSEKLQRVAIRENAPAWQVSDELIVNW